MNMWLESLKLDNWKLYKDENAFNYINKQAVKDVLDNGLMLNWQTEPTGLECIQSRILERLIVPSNDNYMESETLNQGYPSLARRQAADIEFM